MKAVETREGPASEPDERIVASSEDPHYGYVGEREVTGSIGYVPTELLALFARPAVKDMSVRVKVDGVRVILLLILGK